MLGGFVKKIIWKRRLARAGDRGTDLGQRLDLELIAAIATSPKTRATGRLRDRRAGFLGQSDRRKPRDSGSPEVIQPHYGRSSVIGAPNRAALGRSTENLSVHITFDFTDTTYLVRRRKLFPAPSPRFFAVNVLLGNVRFKSYSPKIK